MEEIKTNITRLTSNILVGVKGQFLSDSELLFPKDKNSKNSNIKNIEAQLFSTPDAFSQTGNISKTVLQL